MNSLYTNVIRPLIPENSFDIIVLIILPELLGFFILFKIYKIKVNPILLVFAVITANVLTSLIGLTFIFYPKGFVLMFFFTLYFEWVAYRIFFCGNSIKRSKLLLVCFLVNFISYFCIGVDIYLLGNSRKYTYEDYSEFESKKQKVKYPNPGCDAVYSGKEKKPAYNSAMDKTQLKGKIKWGKIAAEDINKAVDKQLWIRITRRTYTEYQIKFPVALLVMSIIEAFILIYLKLMRRKGNLEEKSTV